MAHSLYRRIVTWLLVVLSVVGLILLLGAWPYARLAADESFDQMLEAGAIQIAENTWIRNGFLNVEVPVSAFFVLARRDRVFYKVIDPKGRVIAGDPELAVKVNLPALQKGPTIQSGRYLGEKIRVAVVGKLMYDPDPQGWAIIVLAQTENARNELARDLVFKLLVALLIMGVVTVAGAMLAARQALKPLDEIKKLLDARDPYSLDLVSVNAPVEAQPLINTINRFVDRLNDRVILMRRVIGDVAHQLRTPVTAALGQVEVLKVAESPAKQGQQIDRIQNQLTEMGTLIQKLISHAMVLHRGELGATQPVDINQLVREEIMALAGRPQAQAIDLAFETSQQSLILNADAVTVREALKNILDNALAYGAPSRLHVQIQATDAHVAISIMDDGPGIPQDRWDVIRKPFASRSEGRGGVSLGLSIVQEVMNAHKGLMEFSFRSEGYFVVTLNFVHSESRSP